MINVFEIPVRSLHSEKTEYVVEGDKIIISINGLTEEFNFTGLTDGIFESVNAEILGINPILMVEKKSNIITIKLLRLYNQDEKTYFEV